MAKRKTQPEVQCALDEALDRQLLDIIVNGRLVIGPDGHIVKDDDNKPIFRPASAADLNAARGRLKDLGITKLVLPGSVTDTLATQLGLEPGEDPVKNYKLPELDMEGEDAASG